jgi:hypothetical protein
VRSEPKREKEGGMEGKEKKEAGGNWRLFVDIVIVSTKSDGIMVYCFQ